MWGINNREAALRLVPDTGGRANCELKVQSSWKQLVVLAIVEAHLVETRLRDKSLTPCRVSCQDDAHDLQCTQSRCCNAQMMDGTANPHLAIAAVATAGLLGLRHGSVLPPPIRGDPASAIVAERKRVGAAAVRPVVHWHHALCLVTPSVPGLILMIWVRCICRMASDGCQ